MADLLAHLSPAEPVPAGHYGRPDETGVTVRRHDGMALATLIARRGAGDQLLAAAAAEGWALTDAPRLSPGPGLDGVGIAPGRWLVSAERTAPEDLIARLAALAGPAGTVCDQSAGLMILDIGGAQAAEALAKGVGIDLHPRAFPPGAAASTSVAQVALTFWRMQGEDAPCYRFAVPRSFAPAFTRWLAVSAAAFGVRFCDSIRG